MLANQKYFDEIVEKLNIVRNEIECKAKLGLMDGNIHFENYIKGILNILFNLNLINLNEAGNNYPGIDLGDCQAGVGYQVTSTRTSKKINDTLEKYIKNGCNDEYPNLRVFIIGEKQGSYTLEKDFCDKTNFNWKNSIIDYNDIFAQLKNSDIGMLKKMHKYIDAHTYVEKDSVTKEEFKRVRARLRMIKADVEEIKESIEVIARGNSIYSGKISRLKNWEDVFMDISEQLELSQANYLLKFYRKIEELEDIVEMSKEYLEITYKGKYRGGPLLDARFSRYARSYHEGICELQAILGNGLEEYIDTILL